MNPTFNPPNLNPPNLNQQNPSSQNPNELTHWKKLRNPDYLGSWSLMDGADLILTIHHVEQREVVGPKNKRQFVPVVFWQEQGYKPMIINATNAKIITKFAGSPAIQYWSGIKVQIYVEQNVRNPEGGTTEGLRIRPTMPGVAPLDTTYAVQQMNSAVSLDDLRNKFMALPPEMSNHPIVIQAKDLAKSKFPINAAQQPAAPQNEELI